MTSMVDLVAREICRNDGSGTQPNAPCPRGEGCKMTCVRQARAAIAAMRDPIEEQMNAGIVVAGEYISNDEATALVVAATYQHMIDAALADHLPAPVTA